MISISRVLNTILPPPPPYLKVGVKDFKAKSGLVFGIKRMHETRDAENNHRDYEIVQKFGSECRDGYN